MPLSKTYITTLFFITTFLLSVYCSAQGQKDSRTRYVIPYSHKVIAPPGMVYVQGGVTTINYDQSTTDTNSARKVSLTSFFMDRTEVTNQQYRQFTEWVIDSIAIVNYLKDDKYFISYETENKGNGGNSKSIATNTTAPVAVDSAGNPIPTAPVDTTKPMGVTAPASDSPITKKRINWKMVSHDAIFNSKDETMKSKIAPMLDENGNIKKEFYQYTYKHIRHVSSATHNGKDDKVIKETLNVYPNENVWNQDLTNAQTDLFVENYFKSPPFDDYPVVGVTWSQSMAFCNWRSNNARAYYNMPDYMKYYRLIYTLPSEAQFVYAAQGYYDMIRAVTKTDTLDTVNLLPVVVDSTVTPHADMKPEDSATYALRMQTKSADSLRDLKNGIKADRIAKYEAAHKRAANGNLYLMDYIKMLNFLQNGYRSGNEGPIIDSTPIHRDYNGLLSNFKQEEGDYWEDGAALTMPVMSFAPNDFGLYNMEGNVSEWVMDAYSPSAFSFVSDINPQLLYDADSTDADVMKRKVVRGGSFISNAKSLSPFYRDMELMNVSHCFLGFRCVMQAPEVATKVNGTRNRTQSGKKTPGKMAGIRLPEIR